jgi:hypothetical protein
MVYILKQITICPNECDDTCWQRIIYAGDESLLEQWKRK